MSLVAAEDHTRARIYSDGVVPGAEATPELVESYLQRNEFFWLDITRPASATGSRMLDELGLDADTRRFLVGFPRRASVLRSRDHAWIVLHAAVGESGSAEIHAVTSRNFLITTRQDACPPLDALFDSWSEDFLPRHEPTAVVSQALYRLTDTVVTSFTSVLEYIDDEIDDLQSEIVTSPSNEHLQRLFGMQRNIVEMRRVVVPQRDMFGRLAAEVIRLPHEDESTALLFRVTYDQFIRLSDLLDSYRDLLSGALDMHLSTVSNRLGQVTTQLTVIATIFLPLTFITGFFGQNFAFMQDHIQSRWAFLVLGIGTELLALGFLFFLFRRRGWIGPQSRKAAPPS